MCPTWSTATAGLALAFMILGVAPCRAASYTPYDLFPLTQGSSWVYDDGWRSLVQQTTDNNGVLTAVLTNQFSSGHGPGSVTLRASATEVQVVTYSNPNYIMVSGMFPPNPLLRRPAVPGQSWQSSLNSNGYRVISTITVASTNTPVTVGSRTFPNATELIVDVAYPNGYTPGQVKYVKIHYYLVRGAGCIKRLLIAENGPAVTTQAASWETSPAAPPTSPNGALSLATSGTGTLTPNLSNAVLEIGRSYTITATPAPGYVFGHWAGRVGDGWVLSSEAARLDFRMQQNLALTATFLDRAKPTLAVTAPTPNQRWSNSVFTARGTVSDNGPIAQVLCQLNREDWQVAETTNAWRTWSAPLRLTPGTNTLRSCAVDAAGNRSATNTLSFVYVRSAPLTVALIGKGTLAPNLSNAVLELGRSYTLTATPGVGYAFTNWTGRVEGRVVLATNKPVLNFVMQTNLALTATLVDVAKPTLAVTAPTPNQRWSNSVFTARGTVSDNGPIAQVLCQLNREDWQVAETTNAWRTWSAPLWLTPGTNTLRSCAVDAAGNRSATNTLNFTCVRSVPLTVALIGKGTLSPNLSNAVLELGRGITVTATSAVGYVFSNWTVRVDGRVILTTNKPVITFVMQTNLALTATLVDVAKPTLAVTAPTPNQRWSNSVFTAKGTVSDNGPIAQVLCQLNRDDWQVAETTNTWRTWSATLRLTPGTNTLRSCAVDAAGNRSATNALNFIYVRSAPLTVALIGKGTLSPNLSNAVLELGRSYTLTATPGIGYAFTNWTGRVDGRVVLATNKPALSFVMQTNLALTATLVDVAKPTLTIASPTAAQPISSAGAEFTVRGAAADNGSVARVWTRVNNGAWEPATGTTNWQFGATLEQGTNRVSAYAVDAAGNASPTNSVVCTWVPSDEKDIRALIAALKARGEAHDLAGFTALFAPDYLHSGQDRAQFAADLAEVLPTVRTFNFAISRIVISGTNAQVHGRVDVTFNNGAPAQSWTEPTSNDTSPGFGWLGKTSAGWRVRGNQARASVLLATGYNVGGGNRFFRVRTESPEAIESVTFGGPGIAEVALDPDPRYGGFTAFVDGLPTPLPAPGTEYWFLVRFADGTTQTLHDTVKGWVPQGPAITLAPGAGTVTVRWTDVSRSVPEASEYWVRVYGPGVYWESDELPLTRTSAVFDENHEAEGSLRGGQTYTVEVFIFDRSENYAYRILDFTMPGSGGEPSLATPTPPPAAEPAEPFHPRDPEPIDEAGTSLIPRLRCVAVPRDGDGPCLQVRLIAPVGVAVHVESSPDLVHWAPFRTVTATAGGLLLSVPATGQPARFFRVRPEPATKSAD